MADLNKFQRSKDKIKEVINYLVQKPGKDEGTILHINNLQESLQVIDNKIDELKRRMSGNPRFRY